MFNKEVYAQRRALLRQLMGEDGIVIFLSNNEAPMNYPSNTYRYRQDSTFLYFYGLQRPGLTGITDLENDDDFIFGDDYTLEDVIWIGAQPPLRKVVEGCLADEVRPSSQLADYIREAQRKGRKIHFLPPYRMDNRMFLHRLLGLPLDEVNKHASAELIMEVVNMRAIKTEEEIGEMDLVCNLGVKMHRAVMGACKSGLTERHLAGLAEGIAHSYGSGVSFPIILSQNGETLHNHDHSQILQDGRLLLADMGAEALSGYSSDYTRTFPVSGRFTGKQKDIYEIVLRANLSAIEAAKPGIAYFDIHLKALTIIAEGLKDLGLMRGNPQEAAAKGAVALFMPHGLGHHLGLDVHDMEDLGENYVGYDELTQRSVIFGHSGLRCGRQLQEGFIVTDEPGIYFIPQLIERWQQENKFSEYICYDKVEPYLDFGGIRIEDDLLITETGCRVLGEPLPKQVNELEALIGTISLEGWL